MRRDRPPAPRRRRHRRAWAVTRLSPRVKGGGGTGALSIGGRAIDDDDETLRTIRDELRSHVHALSLSVDYLTVMGRAGAYELLGTIIRQAGEAERAAGALVLAIETHERRAARVRPAHDRRGGGWPRG